VRLLQWAGFGRDGFGRAGLFRAGVPNLSSARSPVWNREAINATKEISMKDVTNSSLDQKSSPAASSPAAVEPQPVRALAAHLEMIEANVQRARDTACLFAYLTQEVPDSSKHIELDRQALRGVMERIYGDLDEALQSMDQTSSLLSLIANKPNL
jgi:hypothetical protein